MHPSAIARVATSYGALSGRLDELVDVFYRRLFETYPGVRPMFPVDMARQKGHLAASLALVCKNLSRLDLLEEPLMSLGASHVRYGARPEHYPIVRDTLLDALGEVAGASFTAELRRDWAAALNEVAAVLLRGAARAAEDAAAALPGARAMR
jgi:hemoglobin-like flavoprotein